MLETVREATELVTLAKRLLAVLGSPITLDGVAIVPSASIGAAMSVVSDTPDQLLRHADIAMYRAKSAGRNTWRLPDPQVSDPTTNRLRIIGELRHGIESRQ